MRSDIVTKLFMASFLAFALPATAGAETETDAMKVQCLTVIDGNKPIIDGDRSQYAFTLSFGFTGPEKVPAASTYMEAPLTDLRIEGFPNSILPMSFSDGFVEFHPKFGLTGIYAKIGSDGDRDLRLRVDAGPTDRAKLHIFYFRERDSSQEERLIAFCAADRSFADVPLPKAKGDLS